MIHRKKQKQEQILPMDVHGAYTFCINSLNGIQVSHHWLTYLVNQRAGLYLSEILRLPA